MKLLLAALSVVTLSLASGCMHQPSTAAPAFSSTATTGAPMCGSTPCDADTDHADPPFSTP